MSVVVVGIDRRARDHAQIVRVRMVEMIVVVVIMVLNNTD